MNRIRRVMACGLLLCVCSCAADKQDIKKKADSHKDLGIALMSEQNYTEALREFMEAEQINPGDAIVQNYLGVAFLAKGDMDNALLHIHKAIQADPHYAEAYNNLGRVYLGLNKWDEAIASCKKALGEILYSTPQFAWENMGEAYMGKKNYSNAMECFRKAIETSGSSPRAVYVTFRLGDACYAGGAYGEAVAALEKVRALRPDFVESRMLLGEAYIKTRDFKKAAKEFKDVLAQQPAGPLADKAKGKLRLLK